MSCSIGSYNILNPFHAVKWRVEEGLNDIGLSIPSEDLRDSTQSDLWKTYSNWNTRVYDISENLQKTDIVCLQEITYETLNKLLDITEDYLLASEAYQSSSSGLSPYSNFFGNALLYNARKIEFNDSFTVDYQSGNMTRRAACGVFNIGEKTIQVASVHLTGYNPLESTFEKKQASKKYGYKELQTYIEKIKQRIEESAMNALVIGGDFNEDPNEAKFDFYRPEYLKNRGYFNDGNLGPTEPSKQRKIDWIFAKPITENFSLQTMNLEKKQKQASDHLMTGTVIEWQNSG